MLARTVTIHPIADEYDDFTEAELAKMRVSLVECGLINPIVVWHGQIVDGRHREKLCRELNVEPRYDDISTLCPTEADMRKHVTALNQYRRARTTPLTSKEKRMKIAEELKANPDRSDREIAAALGVSPTSVGKARTGDGGTASNLDTVPTIVSRQEAERVKKERVLAELEANPNRSNRVIGRAAGASHALVMRLRRAAGAAPEPQGKEAAAPEMTAAPETAAPTIIGDDRRSSSFTMDSLFEKRKRVADMLSADPDKSDREIAHLAGVHRELVARIRSGHLYADDNRSVRVAPGKSLSEICREGMALEDGGKSAEDAASELGIGTKSYRIGRDLVRLADNKRLTADDAARVRAAVEFMDERRRPDPAFERVRDISDRLFGGGHGLMRNRKRERHVTERYEITLGILTEASEQAKIAVVPYLDEEAKKKFHSELEAAIKAIKKAIANLKGD